MESLSYSLDTEGLAQIRLDDGKVNAMDLPWFEAVNDLLDRVEQDRPQALLISGRPGFFSAGLNLKVIPTLKGDARRCFLDAFGGTMLRVWTLPTPTVAACTGHAIAGGALLAFACDRRYALDGAYRIQMNETRNAMALPSWALAICRSALPPLHWTEALLHARSYSPAEAVNLGFFHGLLAGGSEELAPAREEARSFRGIHIPAYARSKRRLRDPEAEAARALFETEHGTSRID